MGVLNQLKKLGGIRRDTSVGPSPDDQLTTYQTEDATERWYAHALDAYRPDESLFGFKVDDPSLHDVLIADRLIRYFSHLQKSEPPLNAETGLDMWATITSGHQALEQALDKRDHTLVTEIMREVATGKLVAGFMNVQPYDRLNKRAGARNIEAKYFIDKLLSLAESLGCLPVQCVEQGAFGYSEIDIPNVISSIQKNVDFELNPPSAGGGSFGLKFKSTVVCIKDLYAIYTAIRACKIVSNVKDASIAEIGGGTGTLAYYLVKAGCRVSVFDLPTVSVIQAYYLMRSLGPEQVWLYGEEDAGACAHVYPFWALEEQPDKSFDLFVNQDSLPEIFHEQALHYLSLIKSKGSALLSINQEGQAKDEFGNPQSVVFRLIDIAQGYKRIDRFLHWMRLGYIEEYYRVI